jgi:general secretion pathway protein E
MLEHIDNSPSEPAVKSLIDNSGAGPGSADSSNSGVAAEGKLDMLNQTPAPEALKLVSEQIARKYNLIPLSVDGNTLKVAMATIGDVLAISTLAALTKKRIEVTQATAKEIQEAIDFNYKNFNDISAQFGWITDMPEAPEAAKVATDVADDSPVARALKMLINEAVKSRASDIHIEPEADKLSVRYRIDGIMHNIANLPLGIHGHLISRIKILSGMNIADHLRPQDGQLSLKTKGKEIDIRVATINTVHGEMAVLRLLDKSMAALWLSQLGFLPESQKKFEQMLKVPYGMILICGPTGAGKTTTLYAAINSLDHVGRNIITTEDPVEYRFPGINQIQVNPRAGLTFATALRSIVRLDPDVILIGEIRDAETAEIAIQSALTGHLVLSSVHANDSVGALFRLIDLGIEQFLICSAVIGIVAQRMVRRVCPNCARMKVAPAVEQLAYLRETTEEQGEFSYGAGCKACANTGYLGRTGVFEILPISDGIRRLVASRAEISEIKNCALKEGLITLVKDGMMKAKAGVTTPAEVLRNVYSIT